mgnify:CR=1 FL=1
MPERRERVAFLVRLGPPVTVSLMTVKCRAVPEMPGSDLGALQVAKES